MVKVNNVDLSLTFLDFLDLTFLILTMNKDIQAGSTI